MVKKQLIGRNNIHSAAQREQKQCVAGGPGIEFPISGLLQQRLPLLNGQVQAKGYCSDLIPGWIFLAGEDLIDIGLVQIGSSHNLGSGQLLFTEPLLQIFRKAVGLHFFTVSFKVADNIIGFLDFVGQLIR